MKVKVISEIKMQIQTNSVNPFMNKNKDGSNGVLDDNMLIAWMKPIG